MSDCRHIRLPQENIAGIMHSVDDDVAAVRPPPNANKLDILDFD